MADSTIPNLTAATALTGAELFYAVQAGNDRKVTATQIQTFSSLTVGTTSITGGTTGRLLYDNAGIVGEALLTYSAAQLQLGAADAAAPVAQTTSVQSVVAGTSNTAGADWTFNASRGTGTGAGGRFVWQLAPAGGSGSLQNAFSLSMTLDTTGKLTFNTGTGFPIIVAGSNNIGFGGNGNVGLTVSENGTPNGTLLPSDRILGWGSSGASANLVTAADTMLGRQAAASIRLGAADAASPVAQTLQVQNVAAGNSNVNGANWTINGSVSTGTGTSGDIIFQTGGTGAGATAQNTATTALTIKGATQQVIMATTPRISVAPTANSSASTTITNGADSSSNCGHRLQLNLNGTTYWIPCSSVAF